MQLPRLLFLLSLTCAFARAESVPATDAGKLATIPAQMQKFVDDRTVSGVVTLVATKDRVANHSRNFSTNESFARSG